MKNIFLRMFILLAAIGMSGCEKKFNDWEIDPAHDRLFKPLVFEVLTTNADSVVIKYTQVVSADKYIFEFSKDSLEFTEITKKVEIAADTLIPFAESTSPAKTEYRTTFRDLDGSSGYSIRMKAIDTLSGKESAYAQLYFETGAEQIFTGWDTYTDKVQLQWTPTDRVTNITLADIVTQEVLQNKTLSDVEKTSGSAVLENLSPGTTYRITIYNNDVVRGTVVVKTSGLEGGLLINVNPGDDIATLAADAIAQGKPKVTLLFQGGQTYDLATINLPAGLSDVSFTGVKDDQGNLPLINLDEVKIGDLIFGRFLFENLQMRAGGTKSKYLFNIGSAGLKVKEFNFIGCDIENYRSLVRTTADDIEFGKLNFDNCLMNNMGGYGVVNINRSSVKTDSIVFKNSTLTNLETQLMDVRTKVGYIFIGNCTFYNQNVTMAQLFRFDRNNLPVTIETNANIFSGNNSGAKINAVSEDMPDLSFGGSYRTNELIINQREFNNITVFEGSADDLFIDPSNRNFTVKPESGFGGRGTAGDPRWFK